MIFKLLTYAVLGYLMYKLIFPKKQIAQKQEPEEEWTEYEEVD